MIKHTLLHLQTCMLSGHTHIQEGLLICKDSPSCTLFVPHPCLVTLQGLKVRMNRWWGTRWGTLEPAGFETHPPPSPPHTKAPDLSVLKRNALFTCKFSVCVCLCVKHHYIPARLPWKLRGPAPWPRNVAAAPDCMAHSCSPECMLVRLYQLWMRVYVCGNRKVGRHKWVLCFHLKVISLSKGKKWRSNTFYLCWHFWASLKCVCVRVNSLSASQVCKWRKKTTFPGVLFVTG